MNPFDEQPETPEPQNASGNTPENKQPHGKKPVRRVQGARKVTYAAAAAAIGAVCSLLAIYLPTKVMPLVMTAFCFYVVFDRCGWMYGFITEAVVLLLTFFLSGVVINVTFVLLALVFVPYAPLAYLFRGVRYRGVRRILLRALAVAAFANLALVCVYFTVVNVTLSGLDIPAAVGKVGGYWVLALLLTPIAISVDFLFTQMSVLIGKILK